MSRRATPAKSGSKNVANSAAPTSLVAPRGHPREVPYASTTPKTPVEVLIELGRALHGEHWIGPTARDLDMRHDTVTKWVSGKRSPPGPILDALRLLVKSHTQAVARAREISGKAT
jgi:hypothetical protein